jgi:hypothetical protein
VTTRSRLNVPQRYNKTFPIRHATLELNDAPHTSGAREGHTGLFQALAWDEEDRTEEETSCEGKGDGGTRRWRIKARMVLPPVTNAPSSTSRVAVQVSVRPAPRISSTGLQVITVSWTSPPPRMNSPNKPRLGQRDRHSAGTSQGREPCRQQGGIAAGLVSEPAPNNQRSVTCK